VAPRDFSHAKTFTGTVFVQTGSQSNSSAVRNELQKGSWIRKLK